VLENRLKINEKKGPGKAPFFKIKEGLNSKANTSRKLLENIDFIL
jgi:hypothetical protein